jgi:ribosomal protein S15P/S13E
MGNLFSNNKYGNKNNDNNVYEPFVNKSGNTINLAEQIKVLLEQNRALEEELRTVKKELDSRTSIIDLSIQNKYNELSNLIGFYNEKNNEKIKIINKYM